MKKAYLLLIVIIIIILILFLLWILTQPKDEPLVVKPPIPPIPPEPEPNGKVYVDIPRQKIISMSVDNPNSPIHNFDILQELKNSGSRVSYNNGVIIEVFTCSGHVAGEWWQVLPIQIKFQARRTDGSKHTILSEPAYINNDFNFSSAVSVQNVTGIVLTALPELGRTSISMTCRWVERIFI